MPGGEKWEGGKANAETFTLLPQAVLTFSGAVCPCLPLPFSQVCIPKSAGLPNLSIKSTLLAPASHSHAVKVKSMFLQSEAEASLPLHPRHSCSTSVSVTCHKGPSGVPASWQVCRCCMNPCGDLLLWKKERLLTHHINDKCSMVTTTFIYQ